MSAPNEETERAHSLRRVSVWVHRLGHAVVLAALAYLVYTFWTHRSSVGAADLLMPSASALAVCALCFTAAQLLMAVAWHRLLRLYPARPSFRTAYRIYARTQIAKYLPGNVFQFAGRHTALDELGLGHAQVGGTSLFEIISLTLTASTLALLGLALGQVSPGPWRVAQLAAACTVMLLAPIVLNELAARVRPLHTLHLPGPRVWSVLPRLLPTVAIHALFFLTSAGVFVLFAAWTHPDVEPPLLPLWAAYLTAWVLGFVVPGAPGGAGIREAVLTAVLGSSYGSAGALALAVGFRMVTLLSDLLFFLTSYWARARSPSPTTPAG